MSDYNYLFVIMTFLLITPIVIYEIGSFFGEELPTPTQLTTEQSAEISAAIDDLCSNAGNNVTLQSACTLYNANIASNGGVVATALNPVLANALNLAIFTVSTEQEGVLGSIQSTLQKFLTPFMYVYDSYSYTYDFLTEDVGINGQLVIAVFLVLIAIVLMIVVNKVMPFT